MQSELGWAPLSQAARELNISESCLRNWSKGRDSKGKPVAALQSKTIAGSLAVHVETAFEHISRHATRPPVGLRNPAAIFSAPTMPTNLPAIEPLKNGSAIDCTSIIPDDMTDLLRGLAVRLHNLSGATINPDMLRAIGQAVKTLEDIQVRRDKILRQIDPDEAVAMLRALGETYADEIGNAGAGRAAEKVLRWMREVFDIDLAGQNIEAARLLEAQLREDAQETIAAVQKCVDEKCRGVTLLPLEAVQ